MYLYYPVLKQHIQYEFEPCDNDPIDKITAEHSSAVVTLSKEAKRWATKIGRENNCIKENNKKLQTLLALRDSGQKVINSKFFFSNQLYGNFWFFKYNCFTSLGGSK